MNAIKTPIPGVFQAGQWTYSPAGLPISILTGKLAADRVIKELSKAIKRLIQCWMDMTLACSQLP